MGNNLDKSAIRQVKLTARKALGSDWVDRASRQIAERLFAWDQYQNAKHIMSYLAMPDEPQTDWVITQALAAGKIVSVPSFRKQFGWMDAVAIKNLDDLVIGRLGLRVPDPAFAQPVNPRDIDLLIVPGVAFDRQGGRVGMGAGYYDRFLPQASQAVKLGAAWSFQCVDRVPLEAHDIPMDYLITEEDIIRCR